MELILAFASIVAAIVPMFLYLLVIWWLDRNDREPFWILLLNFFWGATGAIIIGIVGSIIFQIPLSTFIQDYLVGDASDIDLSGAVITAPLVEEFAKGIFLVAMSMTRRFDGTVDGVVYGGAIGLGFGMTENFLYFVSYASVPETWLFVVVIRTLFSAVMHCMAQATFGACVGFAKFKPAVFKIILIPVGFLIAVFLHFAWNLTVSFEETSLLGIAFLIMYFFAIFAVFQISLYLESRTIIRELQDEASIGNLPLEHLNYIPYMFRRFRGGWCPAGVNQKLYVKTAIALALRKNQYKHTSGSSRNYYKNEIDNCRYKIQLMFYNAGLQYNHAQNAQLN
jgi:Predicted membrane protein